MARDDQDLSVLVDIDITKDEALLLCASLHNYLRYIEQEREGDSVHFAQARTKLGRLIWRLEEAAAWPRVVGKHSSDAVNPHQAESPPTPSPSF